MQRCLQLAEQGLGHTASNPLVGAVLVHQGQIVSEGYHEQYGQAHAEVNAIKHLKNQEILKDCTLYVNLEPCSHFGKTPPCSDLIIEKGIKKVVVANLDTNPLVSGKGIEKLKNAGIEVTTGILDQEARSLNKRFFTFQEKKRPYIILKWAQTADGFISRNPLPKHKEDNWITGSEAKKLVHLWRSQEQSIMVGTNTAKVDNPELTTRLVNGHNPIRIVIDQHLSLSTELNLFNSAAKTTVFTALKKENTSHLFYQTIDFTQDIIPQILNHLFLEKISSVIIEGGTQLLQSFIDKELWDEARIFVNPNLNFVSGLKAPDFDFSNTSPLPIGADLLYTIVH